MGLNTADYIHQSLSNNDNCYSVLRLTNTTLSQYAHMILSSDTQRYNSFLYVLLEYLVLYVLLEYLYSN